MNIFVSYTSIKNETSLELLFLLNEKIKTLGNIYIEKLDSDVLKNQEKIINMLKITDVMLVINTPSIFFSSWAVLELEFAKKNNIKTIIITPQNIISWSTYDFLKQISKFQI